MTNSKKLNNSSEIGIKTRYIDADAMLENYEADCEAYENNGDSLDTELWMIDYLKNHLSADVQPVVHAKILNRNDIYNRQCSNCKNFIGVRMTTELPYCPYCGAKMDEK